MTPADGSRRHDPAQPDDAPYAQTLGRGIDIVQLLAEKGSLSSRAIGDALGLNRSTSYRLVQTLVFHGLVQRSAEDATYSLTPRLWELGVSAIGPPEVRAAAGRAIRELAEKYGETVHLGIYDHGEVVYIDKADGWQPIGSYTRLGGRAPAYCVATGKALLAHQRKSERDRCLATRLQSFTPQTLTDPAAVNDELEQIRQGRHAVNRGEWRHDVGGLAVPLFDLTGDLVAALGFSGPADRIAARSEELLTALRKTAHDVSRDPA